MLFDITSFGLAGVSELRRSGPAFLVEFQEHAERLLRPKERDPFAAGADLRLVPEGAVPLGLELADRLADVLDFEADVVDAFAVRSEELRDHRLALERLEEFED